MPSSRGRVSDPRSAVALAAGAAGAVFCLALLVALLRSGGPVPAALAGAATLCAIAATVIGARRSTVAPAADGTAGRPLAEAAHDEAWGLRDRLVQLDEVLDGSGDLVIRTDSEDRVSFVSRALADLLGETPSRLVGQPFWRLAADLPRADAPPALVSAADPADPGLIPADDGWAGIRARLTDVLSLFAADTPDGAARDGATAAGALSTTEATGPAARPGWLTGDLPLRFPDGVRWFTFTDRAIAKNGVFAGIQTVGRDITARKAVEDALAEARDLAEAASAAKSRFLAMVSHEIRTPLNGVLGMTGLLLQTSLTAEQRTYVRAVETSGEALLLLIEDLLDFAKIEAGRIDLQERPIPLGETIEELAELLAPRASAKGIELAVYVDPALPQTVHADPIRLKQVLFNLAGNGVKFTAEGGVAIEVLPAGRMGSDGTVPVVFLVRDTGIGIAPADAERIFGEFEQASPGPSRSHGGTGLGLAIARRLVRLMGGDIHLDTAPGAGACFSFTIRLRADIPARGEAEADATEATKPEDGDAAVESGPAEATTGARAAQALLAARLGQGAGAAVPSPALTAASSMRPFADRRFLVVSHALVEGPLVVRRLFDLGADVDLVSQRDLESQLAGGARPDAVLLDASAGDPFAILDRIRATTDAPVGILIEPRQRPLLPDLQAAGVDAYLVKPVRARTLQASVRALLGERAFDSDAADNPVDVAAAAPSPDRSQLVLLCDDNDINLLLGRGILEKIGHRVLVAEDGRRAVAAVEARIATPDEDPIDTILMDLHMPEVDGIEASRRIRAAYAAADRPQPRIVALTADMSAETRRNCEPGLFDGWLSKPLMPDALQPALAAERTAPS
ncbi:ATP-binding protein [Mongoliimonas terrestris]|uniref:ATP-binding protein n=1 Tax=Mongoliimonas terrestris TaxID=1709001 RepID=UPI0009498F13|nr:ATP-binding protein [Mongoliimonas terrestris]